MKDIVYEFFNVKCGVIGCDFQTGVAVYLNYANLREEGPVFPILAVVANRRDKQHSRATFEIVED